MNLYDCSRRYKVHKELIIKSFSAFFEVIKYMKRMGRLITNKNDVNYFLSIDEELGTKKSTIMELFGEFNGKHRFNQYDMFEVQTN